MYNENDVIIYDHRNRGEMKCLNIGKICEVMASEGKLFHREIVVLKKESKHNKAGGSTLSHGNTIKSEQ